MEKHCINRTLSSFFYDVYGVQLVSLNSPYEFPSFNVR